MRSIVDDLLVKAVAERGGLGAQFYDPATEAVVASRMQNEEAKTLAVLFPPWHGGRRGYNILSSRLRQQGMAVLRYTFNDDILHENPHHVAASFDVIQNEVAADLHAIHNQGRFNDIKLVGVSLGTPAMAMVASEFEHFDSATLATPGATLAHCLWDGRMTQHFRRAYQKAGIESADELDELWRPIAPVRHIEALAGKAVRAIMTTADDIIPTEYQEEYVAALQTTPGVEAQVHHLRTGHYAGIAAFCIQGKLAA